MPDVALNGIEFTIKSNTKDAISSIDKLRRSLSKLAKSDFATPLRALADEMEDFAESVNKLDTGNLSSFTKGLKGIMDISKKVHESFADYDDGFKRMVGYLQDIGAIDLSNLEGAAQNLRDIVAAAKALQNAQGNGGVETVVGEPDFLRTALSGIADSAKSAASAVGKFALNFVTFPFRKIGSGLKSLNGKLGNIIGSLKRIAFYRIIRSVIKAITQSFQEGLKNAYEFSKATGDRAGLAEALDTLATKSLTMKNQLGAAFGQLLTAITPIVVQIIGWVNKLAEALTRLIAILGGSDTYLRAKDVWTEWGEAAAGAGGAAKKALEYLAPFDELNVLPDPKSGGGGGGSAANIGDMFEYVNTSEGNGFLDAIKDMLDRVSNFFETTNWRELADKAWQKLKEAFSDDGKATEVLKSLFEALGAAIGGVSAFIIEFARNLWEDVTAKFKSNLRDYNGDNKITVTDFLVAVFKTGVDVGVWVYDTIVKPLFDGFGRAMTNDPNFDFSEWAITHIVNPIIEAWNGLATHLINPIITAINDVIDYMNENWGANIKPIKLMGTVDTITIGDDVETGDGLVWQNRTKHFETEFNADVTSATDNIPYSGKTIGQCIAEIVSSQDSIAEKWKNLKNFVAWLTGAEDNIPASQKNIKSVADVRSWDNNISNSTYSGGKRPFVPAVANVGSWYNNISNSVYSGTKKPFIPATANVNRWYNDISNSTYSGTKRPFISSTANVNRWYNDISNSTYSGTKRPFITSTANVNRWYNDISNSTYSGTKKPFIPSTADVNRWDNNISNGTYGSTNKPYISSVSNLADYRNNLGTPSISSNAYINDYRIDSSIRYYGDLSVDAYVNIRGQTNTPTVTVNAQYTNQTRARGGVFSGGAWHDIPQYASGGRPHGSLFLAGEAGPEIVGHVGSRTEVLNRSQLAATMYSAVRSAMASTGFRISASPSPAYSTSDGAGNEDVLYRAFRRALDETDFGGDVELDGQTLYKAMVNRNRQNTRLTGVNAMA